MTYCSSCHGKDLYGTSAPALAGKSFNASWRQHTIADLYKFIQTSMPFCAGGTLADQDYANIVAFILSKNGVKSGNESLNPAASKKISDIVTDNQK